MSEYLQSLIDSLSRLSPEQLDEVYAKAKLLAQMGGEKVLPSDEQELIWDALKETLSSMGATSSMPFRMLCRSPMGSSFPGMADILEDFLKRRAKIQKKIFRRQLYARLFGYLAEWLTQAGIPVSPTTLIRHGHRIPSLVAQKFPGYLSNGLLSLISGDDSILPRV
jgi:hypothetical protein